MKGTVFNSARSESTVTGVACDVRNCVYNEEEYCTAEEIKVGPQYAASTADTICVTFRPR